MQRAYSVGFATKGLNPPTLLSQSYLEFVTPARQPHMRNRTTLKVLRDIEEARGLKSATHLILSRSTHL